MNIRGGHRSKTGGWRKTALGHRANMDERDYGGSVLRWEEGGSETVPRGERYRDSARGGSREVGA
jgi:hypothetical protein